MKKATKIMLLVALGLILTGTVLFCIGAAKTEFRFYEWSGGRNGDVKTSTYELKEPFSNITVKEISGDIRILPSTDGVCKVVCRETERMQVTVEIVGDTLTVTRRDKSRWYEHIGLFIVFPDLDVTLYLPEAAYQELSLHSVSGDVQLSGSDYTFSGVSLGSTSGDLTVNGNGRTSEWVSDLLRLDTTSGNVNVTQMHGKNSLGVEIDTTSGDVRLNGVDCKTLWIDSVSGDIELQTVLSDGKTTLSTVSGDIELEYVDAGSFDIETTSGDVEGILLSDKQFITDTTSGEVRVPNSQPGAGICEIETTSGDIKLRVQMQS